MSSTQHEIKKRLTINRQAQKNHVQSFLIKGKDWMSRKVYPLPMQDVWAPQTSTYVHTQQGPCLAFHNDKEMNSTPISWQKRCPMCFKRCVSGLWWERNALRHRDDVKGSSRSTWVIDLKITANMTEREEENQVITGTWNTRQKR